MKTILKEVIDVAKAAGDMIKHGRDFEINEKTDQANIVTTMDLKVQDFILEKLTKMKPNAKIIAEENEFNEFDEGYVWVVDPIDATTNFAYDCKHSCTSIALLHNLEGVLGVVYNPYLDELFTAIKGEGSYLNGKKLQVTKHTLESSLIVFGTAPYQKGLADYTFSTAKTLLLNARDLRRTGSAVLDICYVACGRFDAFFEASLAPWDYAAAATILKEAGGIIDAIKPDIWGYSKSIGMIAGNESNFEQLKELTKR